MAPIQPDNTPPGAAPGDTVSGIAPRVDGRKPGDLRPIRFTRDIAPNAAGSVLIEFGDTRVICAATVDESVPRWMREQSVVGGWVTAEYSMLPYCTLQRKAREIARGRIEGRSQEIQRLIGRAMRAAIDLKKLGTRTVWIDCDVLQADGGTRTASITGGYVALARAIRKLRDQGLLDEDPLLDPVAAVSLGVVNGENLLDLNYVEDVGAEVDLNLVMTGKGEFIEIQGTGEKGTFSGAQLAGLLDLGKAGIAELVVAQAQAVSPA